MQVLHNGHDHWVVVSTIGCGPAEVDIFVRLPPALTGSLRRQIAALLSTQQSVIRVRYVLRICLCSIYILLYTCRYRLCQMQDGASDCGLFALAFASVLASGRHTQAAATLSSRKCMHTCMHALQRGNFPSRPLRNCIRPQV